MIDPTLSKGVLRSAWRDDSESVAIRTLCGLVTPVYFIATIPVCNEKVPSETRHWRVMPSQTNAAPAMPVAGSKEPSVQLVKSL